MRILTMGMMLTMGLVIVIMMTRMQMITMVMIMWMLVMKLMMRIRFAMTIMIDAELDKCKLQWTCAGGQQTNHWSPSLVTYQLYFSWLHARAFCQCDPQCHFQCSFQHFTGHTFSHISTVLFVIACSDFQWKYFCPEIISGESSELG